MREKIDLTGQRFGRLIALYETEPYISKNGDKIRQWHCKCDCGNEIDVYQNHLRRGNTKSCGCLKYELLHYPTHIDGEDIIGKQFGKLTVLKRVPTPEYIKEKSHIYYECECSCEKHTKKIVYRSHLLNGKIQSCGCYQKEQSFKNKKGKIKGNEYDLESEDYGICFIKGEKYFFDKEDFNLISKYTWTNTKDGYAITTVHVSPNEKYGLYMHKLIMENSDIYQIDHIDGNPRNNQKYNLRPALIQENSMNHKIHSNNTSGTSGVFYSNTSNKWVAKIGYKMKSITLGYYNTKEEAVQARKDAEEKYYGDWSRNKSEEVINKNKGVKLDGN